MLIFLHTTVYEKFQLFLNKILQMSLCIFVGIFINQKKVFFVCRTNLLVHLQLEYYQPERYWLSNLIIPISLQSNSVNVWSLKIRLLNWSNIIHSLRYIGLKWLENQSLLLKIIFFLIISAIATVQGPQGCFMYDTFVYYESNQYFFVGWKSKFTIIYLLQS